ncbi:SRPBCC family protein [Nocardioides mangrovi]|uniref:SRPBCC family protein n=1 Tax=Nocardioides mangrovi TaxID=2874580 RepID=A0ABS7UAI9_9ACTN|nr:SRPBCC family protein [Nocardioides mangrovi]MBZ5737986.1 SRPBCC family protein [Nocardioides mangrovi]
MSASDVSASTTIAAPPATIFAILADPRQHARIDGSGTVRGAVSGPERLELGSRFGMRMKLGAPYRIRNTVVEYDADRLIAWRHVGTHRWRYELEPTAEGTRVTETWDVSRCNGPTRWVLGALGYPRTHARSIERTLATLKTVAEADTAATAAP